MSHFSVLVIGDNIEEQLQPYHEYECTGIKDKYVIDMDITKIVREEYEKEDKNKYPTFEQFLIEWYGYEEDDEYGYYVKDKGCTVYSLKSMGTHYTTKGKVIKVGKFTNPDAKWDWWVVGGRWSNRIVLKNGTTVNSAKMKDIAGFRMYGDKKYYEREWEVFVEKKERTEEEIKNHEFMPFWKPEYYIERYGTKEEYVKRMTTFYTYAVVRDGEWYGKGDMGWWGMSSETADEAKEWEENYYDWVLNDIDPDTLVTIVDCHI